MKRKLFVLLVICLLFCTSTAVADSSNVFPSNFEMRVFRLTANEVETAYVKWGPRFCWMLTAHEIDSLIIILIKARKEDVKPYLGSFPKGGPFQVILTTKSDEHFTFTVGVGGEGYVLCEEGKVYLPEFYDLMKPFIVRRADEAKQHM